LKPDADSRLTAVPKPPGFGSNGLIALTPLLGSGETVGEGNGVQPLPSAPVGVFCCLALRRPGFIMRQSAAPGSLTPSRRPAAVAP
jgi:hypothetical protein